MRRLPSCALFLTPALLFAPAAAPAQTDEESLTLVYGDQRNISIATGARQPIRSAPSVATVITAEDIATMGAVDLDEVLETVPGLHVARSANLYSPLYVIRGIFSTFTPQTLVLQNGIPVTTLFQGNKGNLWGGYPIEHIARIEVIRGPGSALYGADAYSGVINLITKTAAQIPGTQLGVRAGSFKTRDAWVLHGGKLGPAELALYLRVGSTEGFKRSVEADAQTRNDAIFGTSVSLAPGPVNTQRDAIDGHLDLSLDKWRLRFGAKLRDELGTGAGVASALDPVGKGRSDRYTADLSWTDAQFTQNWSLGLGLSYLYYAQRIPKGLVLFPPGVTFPTGTFPEGMIGSPETWERQWRFSTFATYTGWYKHRVRLGAGHDDLDLYKTREFKNFSFTASGVPVPEPAVVDFTGIAPFLLPQRRRVDYVYVQDEWQFAKDWTLTAGVRRDHYSDFGGTTNPRLALVWDARHDLTAKLLYGSAFRAPAFVEFYGINNPVARGNPNLVPETIRTFEAALAWQARESLQLNLNVYRYLMKNIIRTVPNPVAGTGSTYQNTGDQKGRGAELEAVWDINRSLRLAGNYAFQRSIDKTTGQDAGNAPHHQLYGRVDWRYTGGWLLSSQLNWVSERKRVAGDARPAVPDYTTVDLTVRSDRGKNHWDVAATVRNLFNADVREASLAPGLVRNDLPMARRAVYVQASHGF